MLIGSISSFSDGCQITIQRSARLLDAYVCRHRPLFGPSLCTSLGEIRSLWMQGRDWRRRIVFNSGIHLGDLLYLLGSGKSRGYCSDADLYCVSYPTMEPLFPVDGRTEDRTSKILASSCQIGSLVYRLGRFTDSRKPRKSQHSPNSRWGLDHDGNEDARTKIAALAYTHD